MEPVTFHALLPNFQRQGKGARHVWHRTVKRCVQTDYLRQLGHLLPHRFHHGERSGQVQRRKRHRCLQLPEHFRRKGLMFANVRAAMHHTVTRFPEILDTLLVDPIQRSARAPRRGR